MNRAASTSNSSADAHQKSTSVEVEMPHGNLVKHILDNTTYSDPDFIAASIIAARYDDPQVPVEISAILSGKSLK